MKQTTNPWAGLASYQDPAAGSTLLFCGRDNESYDLAALVDDQDEQWMWAWFASTCFMDSEGKVRFPVLMMD